MKETKPLETAIYNVLDWFVNYDQFEQKSIAKDIVILLFELRKFWKRR